MHVCIDCRSLLWNRTGIATYTHNLIEALSDLESEDLYTLLYVSGKADANQLLRIQNPRFKTKLWRLPNSLLDRLMHHESSLNKYIQGVTRRFDVVHEPAFDVLPVSPKLVVTVHDMGMFRRAQEFRPEVAQHFQNYIRSASRNATAIITDSEHGREEVIDILGVSPERVHAIHLGVDRELENTVVSDDEAQQCLSELGINRPFLLTIGDIIIRKNNISVLNGFASLPASLKKECMLVIAGRHIDHRTVEELREVIQKYDLKEAVLLPGFIDYKTRSVLMKQAAALLYPSVYEGFGLPPLEAMACGVPTISAASTSIPEVVGQAGILVKDFLNPEAWADAIHRLLVDNDLRTKCIIDGRERARLFTWEETARKTAAVYRSVHEADPRPRLLR